MLKLKSAITSLVLIFTINLLINNVAFVKTVVDFPDDSDRDPCDRIKFPGVQRATVNGLATTYTSGRNYRFGKAAWRLLPKKVENPRLVAIYYYEAKRGSAENDGDFEIGFSTHPDRFFTKFIAATGSKGIPGASVNRKFRLEMNSNTVLGIGLIVSPPDAHEPPQAFFTVNGMLVVDLYEDNDMTTKQAGHHIPVASAKYAYFENKKIYPYVSTEKANTIIELNFGKNPFIYDVKTHPLPPFKHNSKVSIDVTATYLLGSRSHKLNTLEKVQIVHGDQEICRDVKFKNHSFHGKTSTVDIERDKCHFSTSTAGKRISLRLVYKLPNKKLKGGNHSSQTIDIKIGNLLNKDHYPGFDLRIELDCNKPTGNGQCTEDPKHSKLIQSSKYRKLVEIDRS